MLNNLKEILHTMLFYHTRYVLKKNRIKRGKMMTIMMMVKVVMMMKLKLDIINIQKLSFLLVNKYLYA